MEDGRIEEVSLQDGTYGERNFVQMLENGETKDSCKIKSSFFLKKGRMRLVLLRGVSPFASLF